MAKLLFPCLFLLAQGKLVATLVESEQTIAAQFCFPTVLVTQGKGTITIEAISTEANHRIAVFPILSSAEIRALLSDSSDPCETTHTQATFTFPMAKPNTLYFQLFKVKAKPEQCFSVVAMRCAQPGKVNAGIYLDFVNDREIGYWDTAFSLEEVGLLRLFLGALVMSAGMAWWYVRSTGEMELQGVHPQLLILGRMTYISLACAMACWASYYVLYSVTGMPSVLFKSMAIYSQWVFELSTLALLSLNATGYFLRDQPVLLEVQVVLVLNAVVSLYLNMRKALEPENEVQFHWYWDTAWYAYSRLGTSIVLGLWSRNGYSQLGEGLRDRGVYWRMLVAGVLWIAVQPIGILAVKGSLERFRWKFYQAGVTVLTDQCLCAWLLTVLNPATSPLLFSKETAIQTLKSSHRSLV
jgi:hypothetical protein